MLKELTQATAMGWGGAGAAQSEGTFSTFHWLRTTDPKVHVCAGRSDVRRPAARPLGLTEAPAHTQEPAPSSASWPSHELATYVSRALTLANVS